MNIITGKDIQDLYIDTEHGIFTPLYTYESYDPETDTYQGFEIKKTARDVYDEWLENKDKPQIKEPTDIELLQKENENLKGQISELKEIIESHTELINQMSAMYIKN